MKTIAILITLSLLIIVVPITNPVFAESTGDILSPLVDFLSGLLNTIFDGLAEFQGDVLSWLGTVGVSFPLVWFVTALLKEQPFFKNYHPEKIATVIGLLLFLIMTVAKEVGYGSEHDMIVKLLVAVVAVITGGTTSQYLASVTHKKTVNSPLYLSYSRESIHNVRISESKEDDTVRLNYDDMSGIQSK